MLRRWVNSLREGATFNITVAFLLPVLSSFGAPRGLPSPAYGFCASLKECLLRFAQYFQVLCSGSGFQDAQWALKSYCLSHVFNPFCPLLSLFLSCPPPSSLLSTLKLHLSTRSQLLVLCVLREHSGRFTSSSRGPSPSLPFGSLAPAPYHGNQTTPDTPRLPAACSLRLYLLHRLVRIPLYSCRASPSTHHYSVSQTVLVQEQV